MHSTIIKNVKKCTNLFYNVSPAGICPIGIGKGGSTTFVSFRSIPSRFAIWLVTPSTHSFKVPSPPTTAILVAKYGTSYKVNKTVNHQ